MTELTRPSIEEIQSRVEAGAKFLDGILDPADWPHRIDLETLDIDNCAECLFGQLHGDYFAMKRMHGLTSEDCSDLGFLVDSDDPADGESEMLDRAWATYIMTRLKSEHAET